MKNKTKHPEIKKKIQCEQENSNLGQEEMKEHFRENCDEQRVQSRETKCTLVFEPMIQLDAEESLGWNF